VVTIGAPRVFTRIRVCRTEPAAADLFDPSCPTRLVLDRIGDKWTVLIVLLPSDGPMRFSALRARLGPVATKILLQTLRRIERDGLVSREIFAEVPPRVEYTLTDLGHSLTGPIAAIGDWAETHLAEISAAQQAFDDQATWAGGQAEASSMAAGRTK
jgi:DNA-binding HxlR family transcriptional regulator